MTHQTVTISFYTYQGIRNKWKAFARMGRFPVNKDTVPELEFFKLLGSGGGNGFSIWPDFGTYAFLGVWKNENAAKTAFRDPNSPLQLLHEGVHEWKTIYMQTFHSHGLWDGKNPFEMTKKYDKTLPLGVITRGTVKLSKLHHFWKFVPIVSRSAHNKKGMIFSKGIGEVPIIQQATFSIWENSEYMMDYAYKSEFHKEVVKKTREIGWYKEDLFARFYPYKVEGTMKGFDFLEQKSS